MAYISARFPIFQYDRGLFSNKLITRKFLLKKASNGLCWDCCHTDLSLMGHEESLGIGLLLHNGDYMFELCADGSIDCKSSCSGFRNMTLTYEESIWYVFFIEKKLNGTSGSGAE